MSIQIVQVSNTAFYVVIGLEHLHFTRPYHQNHTRAAHSVLLVCCVSAQLLYTVGPVQRICVCVPCCRADGVTAAPLQRWQSSPVAVQRCSRYTTSTVPELPMHGTVLPGGACRIARSERALLSQHEALRCCFLLRPSPPRTRSCGPRMHMGGSMPD